MQVNRSGIRRQNKAGVFALLLLFSQLLPAGQNDVLEAAKRYVQETHSCALDHGYQCVETTESDFIGLEADRRMIPGNYFAAWQLAINDFKSIEDLSAQQKQLQHYKIGFSESPSQYIVHFQALLYPAMDGNKPAKPRAIMRGTFGRTTRYWINKSSMEIDKRLFYK